MIYKNIHNRRKITKQKLSALNQKLMLEVENYCSVCSNKKSKKQKIRRLKKKIVQTEIKLKKLLPIDAGTRLFGQFFEKLGNIDD